MVQVDKKEKKDNRQSDNEIINRDTASLEIRALLLLALALLLAFFLWAPVSGTLGEFCQHFALSLAGSLAYVLPLFLLYLAFESHLIVNANAGKSRRICVLLLLLCCLALIAVLTLDLAKLAAISLDKASGSSAVIALQKLWEAASKPLICSQGEFWSGGFIGNLIALGLLKTLGRIASVILLLALILALSVLVFNLSWAQAIKSTAQGLSRTGQDVSRKRKEFRARREIARMNRVVAATRKPKPALLQRAFADDFGVLPPESQQRADMLFPIPAFLKKPGPIKQRPKPLPAQAREHIPTTLSYSLPEGDWYNPAARQQVSPEDKLLAQAVLRPVKIKLRERSAIVASNNKLDSDPVASELIAIAQDITEGNLAEDGTEARAEWVDRTARAPKTEIGVKRVKNTPIPYAPPPLELLAPEKKKQRSEKDKLEIKLLGAKLEKTLHDFGIEAKVLNFTTGPTISRFELLPGPGIKVSRIVSLSDDIALALAATKVRIEAPIPGKSAIGIEIPNKNIEAVLLRGLIESESFKTASSPLTAVLGRDIQGGEILCDISKMPHLLIAGATGSGKSVCINSILISLLYKSSPEELRLLMIDPKVVELSIYNGIPHLLQPVVTDPKKAFAVLDWAASEMGRRYELFAKNSVRDFNSYNQLVAQGQAEDGGKLPLILVVIDELADLMVTTPKEVEDVINRLASMARAAGIHLIIATQRPSVDVVTGLIKSNIPSRIAFTVASQVDSRTILDVAGAEKLQGKGDMLFYPQSAAKPQRGQGSFVKDDEVERVIRYLKNLYPQNYDEGLGQSIALAALGQKKEDGKQKNAGEDELLLEALRIVVETGYASSSLLQRRQTVGYPRAARLIDSMHAKGWIGPPDSSKPRKVLISLKEYEALIAAKEEA